MVNNIGHKIVSIGFVTMAEIGASGCKRMLEVTGDAVDAEDTKKTKKSSRSLVDKAIDAIRALKSPTGSSSKAILNWLRNKEGTCNERAVKKAIKNGVAKGVLEQRKSSFLVAGEAYEDLSEKVEISVLQEGKGERTVESRDQVTLKYVGRLQATGKVFDQGKSFVFQVSGECLTYSLISKRFHSIINCYLAGSSWRGH